jgi:hypothetical protein
MFLSHYCMHFYSLHAIVRLCMLMEKGTPKTMKSSSPLILGWATYLAPVVTVVPFPRNENPAEFIRHTFGPIDPVLVVLALLLWIFLVGPVAAFIVHHWAQRKELEN